MQTLHQFYYVSVRKMVQQVILRISSCQTRIYPNGAQPLRPIDLLTGYLNPFDRTSCVEDINTPNTFLESDDRGGPTATCICYKKIEMAEQPIKFQKEQFRLAARPYHFIYRMLSYRLITVTIENVYGFLVRN